ALGAADTAAAGGITECLPRAVPVARQQEDFPAQRGAGELPPGQVHATVRIGHDLRELAAEAAGTDRLPGRAVPLPDANDVAVDVGHDWAAVGPDGDRHVPVASGDTGRAVADAAAAGGASQLLPELGGGLGG